MRFIGAPVTFIKPKTKHTLPIVRRQKRTAISGCVSFIMDDLPELKWHGSFSILPLEPGVPSNAAGDKIILPQSALEQLLSVSAPDTRFGTSSAAPQLPHPLTFRLVSPSTNKVVYAGIQEFSAPEDFVVLTPYLLGALGLDGGAGASQGEHDKQVPGTLEVHAEVLPKGTYARLRPLEAGYNPDDWKPLLERQLRLNFTSLTKNATIVVQGARGEVFQLLVDKFLPDVQGVCVVDTDLEVDIEALDEEQARETLRQVINNDRQANASGPFKGGAIDIWKDVQGTVASGSYTDYELPSWDRSQSLRITLSDMSDSDALELLVTPKYNYQRALPRRTEHIFSTLESEYSNGTKSILISPTNVEMERAETLQISVYAYQEPDTPSPSGPLSFALRAQIASMAGTESQPLDLTDDVSHGADEEQCPHCLQWVPKQSAILHANFCRRNNILCPECKRVFRKDSSEFAAHWHCPHDDASGDTRFGQQKHMELFHGSWECPSCSFTTNSMSDLARHRTSVCPGKIILCQFCHLEVPQEGDPLNPAPEVLLSGLTAHELADGSRTTECHLCDKIVKLRDMQTHLKHHEMDKTGRLPPPVCRNANCGRTLYGVEGRGKVRYAEGRDGQQSGDVGLCSICYGPLYVSMHDPEGKALRRRIERRYLSQLMSGCRREYCRNEWCKSGREHGQLEARGSSAQTALPLVKPLVATCLDRDTPMFFCVDEMSQQGRSLAEMLASEGLWDVAWCIAAAEAEKANYDRMREWLRAWAPQNSR